MPSYTISTGAVLQYQLLAKHENQEVMSTFAYHVTVTAGFTDEGADLLAAFLNEINGAGALLDKWRDALSVKAVAIRTRAQWVHPTRFAYQERFTIPGQGTVAGDAYPVNTSVGITKRSLFAGRSNVGTLHMPAVPQTFILNGNVTALGQTAYEAVAEALKAVIETALPAATFHPVLFNKVDPDAAPVIVNTSVQPTARVERRRTVGLGS